MTIKQRREELEEKLKFTGFVVCTAITVVTSAFMFKYACDADWTAESGQFKKNGIVSGDYIITKDGNCWKYDTQFPNETKVTVTFDGQFTGEVEDDEILSVNKRLF